MLTSTAPTSSVQRLISRLQSDIASGAMASGAVSGTESELCAYYGVSPTIFRQAARLLEAADVAAMRRGHRGGLVVHGYSLDGAAKSIATYLELTGAGVADLLPPSSHIQAWAVRMAADRMTLAAADGLRRGMADIAAADSGFARGVAFVALSQRLVVAAGNPIISLAHRVALHFYFDVTPFETAPPENFHKAAVKLSAIVEAVIAGDLINAGARIDAWTAYHVRVLADPARANLEAPLLQGGSGRTLSEQLARRMLKEIRLGAWPAGHRLGSEPELMGRYDVSRATFRQSVRLLEQYGAVQCRRGPGGGLFTTAPSPEHVHQLAVTALAQGGADRGDLQEASRILAGLAFDLGLARDPVSLPAQLGHARAAMERDPAGAFAIVTDALIGAADSRFLAFLLQLAARVERDLGRAAPSGPAAGLALDEVIHSLRKSDTARARRALMAFVADFGLTGAAGPAAS